jgi:hypothetical protein
LGTIINPLFLTKVDIHIITFNYHKPIDLFMLSENLVNDSRELGNLSEEGIK